MLLLQIACRKRAQTAPDTLAHSDEITPAQNSESRNAIHEIAHHQPNQNNKKKKLRFSRLNVTMLVNSTGNHHAHKQNRKRWWKHLMTMHLLMTTHLPSATQVKACNTLSSRTPKSKFTYLRYCTLQGNTVQIRQLSGMVGRDTPPKQQSAWHFYADRFRHFDPLLWGQCNISSCFLQWIH